MAEKIVRGEKKDAAPVQKAAETVKKAEPAAKKAAETVQKAPARKPQTIVTPNRPTGGSTIGLRIGAVVLWLLAIVCEVFAIMAIMQYFIPPFGMSPLVFLIIMLVLDLVFAILAATGTVFAVFQFICHKIFLRKSISVYYNRYG